MLCGKTKRVRLKQRECASDGVSQTYRAHASHGSYSAYLRRRGIDNVKESMHMESVHMIIIVHRKSASEPFASCACDKECMYRMNASWFWDGAITAAPPTDATPPVKIFERCLFSLHGNTLLSSLWEERLGEGSVARACPAPIALLRAYGSHG